MKVGRFPFIGNGKAIAMGETEGLVKTVFDAKTGELLGAHMIGAEVTEMIQGYTIARTLETTEAELMHTVFPHPDHQRNDARGGAGRLQASDPFLRGKKTVTVVSSPSPSMPGLTGLEQDDIAFAQPSRSSSLFDRVIQTSGDSAFGHHALAMDGRHNAGRNTCGTVHRSASTVATGTNSW